MLALPFKSGGLGTGCAFDMLKHVDTPRKNLGDIQRVLRKRRPDHDFCPEYDVSRPCVETKGLDRLQESDSSLGSASAGLVKPSAPNWIQSAASECRQTFDAAYFSSLPSTCITSSLRSHLIESSSWVSDMVSGRVRIFE